MDWYEKLVLCVGPLIDLAVLPHLYQMYSECSSKGQSIYSPILMLMFCTLWGIYGVRKRDLPLMLTNFLGVGLNIIYASFIMYYKGF